MELKIFFFLHDNQLHYVVCGKIIFFLEETKTIYIAFVKLHWKDSMKE